MTRVVKSYFPEDRMTESCVVQKFEGCETDFYSNQPKRLGKHLAIFFAEASMPEALRPKLAALRAAFVSGYHTDVDANTGEIRQQDGSVSSLVTFAFFWPLGFSICVSHRIVIP